MSANLYVHFPFCRTKCAYCALYSRAGISQADRDRYVRRLAKEIANNAGAGVCGPLKTIYFGGGSPALCDLLSLAPVLAPLLSEKTEFTVELHPLDVTETKLHELKDLGVNRISMGVQSLNDAVLKAMGRGYSIAEAEMAFARVKAVFPNAGIDLIAGLPKDDCSLFGRLRNWGIVHCSVYSLQNERGLADVPSDDFMLDRVRTAAQLLASLGLSRYEISNYALPGFECQHNLAVWRGEDYLGLGEGAAGRRGLTRTRSGKVVENLSPRRDAIERTIFRLRTREGLDFADFPEWRERLVIFAEEGLLTIKGKTAFLTARGCEVCDTILAELVDP